MALVTVLTLIWLAWCATGLTAGAVWRTDPVVAVMLVVLIAPHMGPFIWLPIARNPWILADFWRWCHE